MQGVSRASQAQVRDALQAALDSGADWGRLSDELFSFVAALDSSHILRRALGDPSRSAEGKRALAQRLLEGKAEPATFDVVATAVAQRWSTEKDLPAALEEAAVEAQVAMAQAGGRADEVEEQLFRFERTVAGTPELRDAISGWLVRRRGVAPAGTRFLDDDEAGSSINPPRSPGSHPASDAAGGAGGTSTPTCHPRLRSRRR